MIHQAKPNRPLFDEHIFSERLASAISVYGTLRHVDCIKSCPLSSVPRKTFAQAEFFTKADIVASNTPACSRESN